MVQFALRSLVSARQIVFARMRARPNSSILVLDNGVWAVPAAGDFRVPVALFILVFDGFAVLSSRTTVSSNSVTVITPGAGFSITSITVVSTAEAAGRFIRRTSFRAAFVSIAGLGMASTTGRFVDFPLADLDTFRASPRVAEFPLRSCVRFGSFFCFCRLTMIDLPLVLSPMLLPSRRRIIRIKGRRPSPYNSSN